MSSILPSNSTAFESALESSVSPLLANEIVKVWNPDTCPEPFLKYLAFSLNVDFWDDNWAEFDRRETLRSALFVHQHKGTIAAVVRATEKAGLGTPIINEHVVVKFYRDGRFRRDGSQVRNFFLRDWASYEITIASVLSVGQAQAAKKIIVLSAPARSHLIKFNFSNGVKHDGVYFRDGSVTRGSVIL